MFCIEVCSNKYRINVVWFTKTNISYLNDYFINKQNDTSVVDYLEVYFSQLSRLVICEILTVRIVRLTVL